MTDRLTLTRTFEGAGIQSEAAERIATEMAAMTPHSRLAAVFVLLALAGCVQMPREQRQPPYDNNTEYPRDRSGDGGGSGGGM